MTSTPACSRCLSTESGQRRGDRWDGEGHRLQRGVSPRFVIGGEDRDVHADEQFVVVLVEDAVGLVEVGRYEDHLHLRILAGQNAALERIDNRIPVGVLEVVGREAVLVRVDGLCGVGKVGLQVGAGAAVGGRHGDVGEHLALEFVRCGEQFERLEEYVDALVAEFVAAAGADDQRVGFELLAQAGFGHTDHGVASLVTLGVVLLAGPYEVVFESVGRDTVRVAAEQVLALVGRDVADGEEGVVVGCGDLLDRVLGRDVELAGQLVGVELCQVVVEGQAVAGDAAAHDGGVAREDGGHVGGVFAQVEARCGGHPLVAVSDNLLGGRAERLHVGRDDHSGGVTEQDGFDIVPLA